MTQKKIIEAKKRAQYRLRPLPPVIPLDQPGRLRVANLMALFAVSHQTLRNRMKGGEIPLPDGYDGVRPYWFNETIRPYLCKPAG